MYQISCQQKGDCMGKTNALDAHNHSYLLPVRNVLFFIVLESIPEGPLVVSPGRKQGC